jgi:hypothetical protein
MTSKDSCVAWLICAGWLPSPGELSDMIDKDNDNRHAYGSAQRDTRAQWNSNSPTSEWNIARPKDRCDDDFQSRDSGIAQIGDSGSATIQPTFLKHVLEPISLVFLVDANSTPVSVSWTGLHLPDRG